MLTLSAIKADVGSIGGHTRPSDSMIEATITSLKEAATNDLIIDFDVTFTGDDICLMMTHDRGEKSGNP